MMRKGPLDKYSVEWVLSMVAAESLSGSVAIRSSTSGTVYCWEGSITFATLEDLPLPSDVSATADPSKETLQSHVESVLGVLIQADEGWYYYDPLEHHNDGGHWLLEVEGTLRRVRDRMVQDQAVRRWSSQPLQLRTVAEPRIVVDQDMWAVLVAMTSPITTSVLVDRLTWNPRRVAVALERLEQLRVLGLPTTASSNGAREGALRRLISSLQR